jgi:hypothetical protein
MVYMFHSPAPALCPDPLQQPSLQHSAHAALLPGVQILPAGADRSACCHAQQMLTPLELMLPCC